MWMTIACGSTLDAEYPISRQCNKHTSNALSVSEAWKSPRINSYNSTAANVLKRNFILALFKLPISQSVRSSFNFFHFRHSLKLITIIMCPTTTRITRSEIREFPVQLASEQRLLVITLRHYSEPHHTWTLDLPESRNLHIHCPQFQTVGN